MIHFVRYLARVGELLETNEEFIYNIGSMKPWNSTSNPIDSTRILKQGVYYCRTGDTADLPSDAYGAYILISFRGIIDKDWYYIYFLFGLNVFKRYTRLSIDNNWKGWTEF